MLSITPRPARLGSSINTRVEKHGEEDVTALDIPLLDIPLSAAELNALLMDPHAHRLLYNKEGDFEKPTLERLAPLRLKDKIEGAVVEIKVGLAQDAVKLADTAVFVMKDGAKKFEIRRDYNEIAGQHQQIELGLRLVDAALVLHELGAIGARIGGRPGVLVLRELALPALAFELQILVGQFHQHLSGADPLTRFDQHRNDLPAFAGNANRHFAARGWLCVAPDMRGFGRTAAPQDGGTLTGTGRITWLDLT